MSPNYGSRLLPTVVDEIASQQPNLTYASIPLTDNISDGFKDVTFGEIASATNYLAAWIERTMGRSEDFAPIAYLGVPDLRYVVVFLAVVKCGYKLVLPSPRNPTKTNASLLSQTNCTQLFYAPEVQTLIPTLLEHLPALNIHAISPLDSLIHPNTPHYPYTKTYQTAKWDPILVLYSSGSTGTPRPIPMNHATFAVGDNDRNLPPVSGRINQNWSLWDFPLKSPFYTPFPPFHLAGFSSYIMLPIYYAASATLVLGPPTSPPSGRLVGEIMSLFPHMKALFCPPVIAQQLVLETSGGLEKCKSLEFLLYAGAPLSAEAGNALSQVTNVCQFYGQTETGPMQALVPRRDDWASLEWHPAQGAVMQSSSLGDGTFELVLPRDPELEGVRSVSCNFRDVEVWRTGDLFVKDGSREGLWRFYGRKDDFIVLANAGKVNPVPLEMAVSAHESVSAALVVGSGRDRLGVVVEVKPKKKSLLPRDQNRQAGGKEGVSGSREGKEMGEEDEALIEAIWPLIQKANADIPSHVRISRDMIIVARKGKMFERAAKGTVIRKATERKFMEEIEALYGREEERRREVMGSLPA